MIGVADERVGRPQDGQGRPSEEGLDDEVPDQALQLAAVHLDALGGVEQGSAKTPQPIGAGADDPTLPVELTSQ
eukprot:2732358-Alexandrium_andersonii.AAC.1